MSKVAALHRALDRALGAPVQRSRPVHGGDVASAHRVELDDGRLVFAKFHRDPPPEFFLTEAAGLEWLAAAQAVPVPQVLAVGDPTAGDELAFVALEWIEQGRGAATTEAELGRSLAALHAAGAPCFGRVDRRTTGSRGLPNEPCASWAEFYATQRLGPLLALAGHALDEQALAGLERLSDPERLAARGGADEPPARLHGDLWAGNRLIDEQGRSWLIDPAAHGGHREFDLAMMRLFGGFGADCFDAYHEVSPLSDGWQDRIELHQIAPLVVHAIKFGGPYCSAAARAIARYR